MAKIIKIYKQKVGKVRFIGKKYHDEQRENGTFTHKWHEFFNNNWFKSLENLVEGKTKDTCEDGDAYIGLMRYKKGEPFQYWIGMFLPEKTKVPEGFEYVDFDASNLGVCYIQGKEREVYALEDECATKITEQGLEIVTDHNQAYWFFERYACPRFTSANEKGEIILDICYYVK